MLVRDSEHCMSLLNMKAKHSCNALYNVHGTSPKHIMCTNLSYIFIYSIFTYKLSYIFTRSIFKASEK